jgi:hypothetical protein
MRGQVVDGLDRLAADGRSILVYNSADSAHRDRLSYARRALRARVTAKPMLRRAIWVGLAPGRKNRKRSARASIAGSCCTNSFLHVIVKKT